MRIQSDLTNIFGKSSVSLRLRCRLVECFSLEKGPSDDHRAGQPVTVTDEQNTFMVG